MNTVILGSFVFLSVTSAVMSSPLHSLFRRSTWERIPIEKKSVHLNDAVFESFRNHIWNFSALDNRDGINADEVALFFRIELGKNSDISNIIGRDFIGWGDRNDDRVLNYRELLRAVRRYNPIDWV